MAGLRSNHSDVWDPDYVPPSSNAPATLPGVDPNSVEAMPVPDGPGEFEKGFTSATHGLRGDVYALAEMAGKASGNETVQQFGEQGVAEADQAAQNTPAPNVDGLFDVQSVTDFTDWAAHGLGTLAPFALSMFATGMLGALGAGAARAASLARGVSAVDNARKVAAASKTGATVGAWAGSAAPSTGTAYRDLKEEGAYNPLANVLEGSIIGLLDAAPASHLLTMLGTPKAGISRGIARGILEQAPMEAVTEATQEGISAGFRKYELGDQYDMSGLPARLVEAGALGALGGGVAGGMAGGIRGFRDSLNAPVKTVYNRVRGIEDAQASQDFDPTEDTNYEGDYAAYTDQLDQNDLPSFDPNYQTFDELASPEDKYSQSDSLLKQLRILNEPYQQAEPDKGNIRAQLIDVYRQVDPETTYRIVDGQVEGLRIPDNFASALVPEESGNITGKTLSERITKAGQKLQTYQSDTDIRNSLTEFKRGEIERLQQEMGGIMTDKQALGENPDPEALSFLDSQYADLRKQRDKHKKELYDIEAKQIGGPFKVKSVRDQLEEEANNRYPDDKDLRSMYVADAARQRYRKQWAADEAKLMKLLEIPVRDRTEQDRTLLSDLQRKVDDPTAYLENRSSIVAPPRAEIEQLLERGGLSPATQQAYEKLLGKSRNPEVDMSLKGVDLQGKRILRTVNADYKVPEYINGKPAQFVYKGEAINMVSLTREAKQQRQAQEKVFIGENKKSGKEKPPEEHGMETKQKRLFNDVMQGLGMLADAKGKGWLPEGTGISIPLPGASKAGVKTPGQKALNELVKIVGADTVVDPQGHTFGEVVASIATKGEAKPRKEAGAYEHGEIGTEPLQGEDKIDNMQTDEGKLPTDKYYSKVPKKVQQRRERIAKQVENNAQLNALWRATKLRDRAKILQAQLETTKTANPKEAEKIKRDLKDLQSSISKLDATASGAVSGREVNKAPAIKEDTARESKSFTYRDTLKSTAEEIQTMDNGFAKAMFERYTKKMHAPESITYLTAQEVMPILMDQRPEWISKLMQGSLNGFKIGTPDGRIGVYVHPKADPQHAAEVLAHELGHAVFAAHIRGADDATIRAIANEYHAWLTKWGSRDDVLMKDVIASKKGPRSALVAMGQSPETTQLWELTESQLDYLLDYEEWFADNVARWFTATKPPQTLVEKFFAKIADAIKWLKGLTPDGSVATLMEQIAGGRREWHWSPRSFRRGIAAAPDLNISAADKDKLSRLASSTIDELQNPSYIASVSVIDSVDPYGALFHNAFGEFLMSEAVQPHVRNMIMRAAMSDNIQLQMRRVFKHDRGALQQLGNTERASAYMYQLWRAGLIKLGDRTDTHFTRIAKYFRDTLGVISDSKNAAEIFHQIEENLFPAFDGDMQRTAVQRVLPGSMAESIVKTFGPSYELAMKPMRTLFAPIDSRVRNTDNPYLRRIADAFHKQPGQMTSEPTMWDMKISHKGRYDNIIRDIFNGKDAAFGNEALDYLYGAKDLKDAPPGTKRVIKRVRLLLREMYNYQKEAGAETGDLGKDYFPWVFNQEYVSQHVEEMRTMLLQDKYKAGRIKLAKYINKRTLLGLFDNPANRALFPTLTKQQVIEAAETYAETGEWLLDPDFKPLTVYNSTEIAEYMIRNANVEMQLEFEMGERKHTPVMRFNNSRLFKFVDPKEIRPFLSNELGETIGLYTSQAVKHAEFVRRFGKDGEVLEGLLHEAERAGASKKELGLAVDYVRASMGTYGRHTAEWLNKYAGIPLPEHDYTPINEKLNKGMGAAIVYQNLRYLGLATLTSLSDVMGIAVRSSELSTAYQSIKSYIHRNQNDLQDLAEMLGIIEHSQISDALGARYDGLHLTGKLRRFNDGFFRLIGLEAWTKATRIMGLAAAESFIVKHATRPGKHSARWLTELNLTEDDVRLTRDGRLKVLSHGERYSASKEELARDDRIRAALLQFTDESILRPNASMRTLWGSDPHYQLFQYLKSFMYTFHERILKRVGHEAMEGNYAAFIWLLSYIPVMFVADLMREAIQFGEGGDPRKENWGFADHLQNSAIRAGLLGYAQQGLEISNDMKFGGYGFSGFAASFDTLMQAPDIFSGEGDDMLKALPGQTIYRDWLN